MIKDVRLLRADEIEVRVGGFNKDKTGGFLLLYKDARVDMKILDETYGSLGWQRDHEVINGNLFCNISVWDESKGQWIKKQDVGVESNNDATKGQASDAFKRAAFNWGIGRELYTSPFIWIQGLGQYDKFKVSLINYNDQREITDLQITDEYGKPVWSTGKIQSSSPVSSKQAPADTKGSKPSSNTKSKGKAKEDDAGGLKCELCSKGISQRVKDFSIKNFEGKVLCMDCQKK